MTASTLDHLSPWFRAALGELDNQGKDLSAWRTKVRVLAPGQPLQPPVVGREVESAVTRALLQNKRVSVTYRTRHALEEKKTRQPPLGLVVRDQVIYLVRTLREYGDIKQLVLGQHFDGAGLADQIPRLPSCCFHKLKRPPNRGALSLLLFNSQKA